MRTPCLLLLPPPLHQKHAAGLHSHRHSDASLILPPHRVYIPARPLSRLVQPEAAYSTPTTPAPLSPTTASTTVVEKGRPSTKVGPKDRTRFRECTAVAPAAAVSYSKGLPPILAPIELLQICHVHCVGGKKRVGIGT